MAIAIDGTPIQNAVSAAGTTSCVLTGLTNTVANDVIVVFASNALATAVTGVSGSTRGAYTLLGTANGTAGTVSLWYFISTTAITENITVSSASSANVSGVAVCFSGVNTSAPWDVLTGSSFVTNVVYHTAGPVVTTTGSAAITEWILGGGIDPSGASPAVDTGFTKIIASTTTQNEYFQVTGGTAKTVNVSTRFTYADIGAALMPSTAAAASPGRTLLGIGT